MFWIDVYCTHDDSTPFLSLAVHIMCLQIEWSMFQRARVLFDVNEFVFTHSRCNTMVKMFILTVCVCALHTVCTRSLRYIQHLKCVCECDVLVLFIMLQNFKWNFAIITSNRFIMKLAFYIWHTSYPTASTPFTDRQSVIEKRKIGKYCVYINQ